MFRFKVTRLVLLVLLLFGVQTSVSLAGIPGFFNEGPSNVLVSYFDLSNGNTFVQVTNTDSTNSVAIHVQVFADLNDCADRNFFDSLTPNQTHVYDISNLQSANGNPINFVLPADSHGFVAISSGDGMGAIVESIIGNFRIVRNAGYEYRVNSAATGLTEAGEGLVARFTDNWGANQADIVGVRVVRDPAQPDPLADGTLDLTVQITDPFELFVFDDEETDTSCAQVQFGCDENVSTVDLINQGINDIFPNTRGGLPLCEGDINTDGFIRLGGPGIDVPENVVGFVGLNDTVGRGSMDRFRVVQEPEMDDNGNGEDPGPGAE